MLKQFAGAVSWLVAKLLPSHPLAFPEAELLFKTKSTNDTETVKALAAAGESFASVPVPGRKGLWKITEVDVKRGAFIAKGVPADSPRVIEAERELAGKEKAQPKPGQFDTPRGRNG